MDRVHSHFKLVSQQPDRALLHEYRVMCPRNTKQSQMNGGFMPERSGLLLAQYSLDPSYTAGLMDKGDPVRKHCHWRDKSEILQQHRRLKMKHLTH